MTLVNIATAGHGRAIIFGVDTEMFTQQAGASRKVISTTKVVPLPHIPAILCVRGDPKLMFAAATTLSHWALDLDAAIKALPASLAGSARFLRVLTRQSGLEIGDRQAVILAGWSESAGRMIVTAFEQAGEDEPFLGGEPQNFYVAPWENAMGECRQPRSVEDLIRLAQRQVGHVREKFGGTVAIGGELLVGMFDRANLQITRRRLPGGTKAGAGADAAAV